MENDIVITEQGVDTVTPAPAPEPAPEPKPISIYARLARAQAAFRPAVKNCVNPQFKNRYADLQSILSAVRPALNANGLYLYQKVVAGDSTVSCETFVASEDGEVLSSGALVLPVSVRGGVTAQGFGSAETYARRYSISAFLGISAEDDDDGNVASAQPVPVPKASAELESAARAAAAQGMEIYREYFAALSVEDRRVLNATGLHAICKSIASGVEHA